MGLGRFVLVVLLVSAGFLLLFFWASARYLGRQSQKLSTSQNSISRTAVTQSGITGWQVYRDSKGIFEINYPLPLIATQTMFLGAPGESKQSDDDGVLSTESPWNALMRSDGVRIEFYVETKLPSESLEAFFARVNNSPERIYSQSQFFTRKEIIVDGRSAYWLEGGGGGVAHVEIYIPRDMFTFVYIHVEDGYASSHGQLSTDHIGLVTTMLSTFHFLDSKGYPVSN